MWLGKHPQCHHKHSVSEAEHCVAFASLFSVHSYHQRHHGLWNFGIATGVKLCQERPTGHRDTRCQVKTTSSKMNR